MVDRTSGQLLDQPIEFCRAAGRIDSVGMVNPGFSRSHGRFRLVRSCYAVLLITLADAPLNGNHR